MIYAGSIGTQIANEHIESLRCVCEYFVCVYYSNAKDALSMLPFIQSPFFTPYAPGVFFLHSSQSPEPSISNPAARDKALMTSFYSNMGVTATHTSAPAVHANVSTAPTSVTPVHMSVSAVHTRVSASYTCVASPTCM